MILDDEDFRRTRPKEYEEMERRNRKRTIKYLLTTDRKDGDGNIMPAWDLETLARCYGEDEVKEVVMEVQAEKDVK